MSNQITAFAGAHNNVNYIQEERKVSDAKNELRIEAQSAIDSNQAAKLEHILERLDPQELNLRNSMQNSAFRGHREVLKVLVSRAPNPTVVDCMIQFAENNEGEKARLFINNMTKKEKKAILKEAIEMAARNNQHTAIRHLIQLEPDISLFSKQEKQDLINNLLQNTTTRETYDNLLINDPNYAENWGLTMHIILASKRDFAGDFLRSNYSNVCSQKYKDLILYEAVLQNNSEMVALILSKFTISVDGSLAAEKYALQNQYMDVHAALEKTTIASPCGECTIL